MSITISTAFDSGNIEVVDARHAQDVRLRIRHDTNSDFYQWFHFRLHAVRGVALRLVIENAAQSSYPGGWSGYHCVASYDRQNWFRIPGTDFNGEVLTIDFTPAADTVWLAYFEPYSHERHLDFIARCQTNPLVNVDSIGRSLQGRDLDRIQIGHGSHPVWIQARQHPGESMAEWFMEGLIERLLDVADPVARQVRELARFHLIPNINPDGSVLGNLRTNAAGANLNREWLKPSLERSPEVVHAQAAMRASGVDLFLDIHGDETLPYVFIDGSHMVPGYGERNKALQASFLENLKTASPDFQTIHGYTEDRFDEELLTLASKWVPHTFGCVSMTLEMPFKDNNNLPDLRHGWSGQRSKCLGAAFLNPILAYLRALG